MKNKAPLALIELVVMILIFSLAAALCLQAFVWSDLTSSRLEERDSALLQAETTAEVVKACRGDFEKAAELLMNGEGTEEGLMAYFDAEWYGADEDDYAYCVEAIRSESGHPLLGQAEITVMDWEGKTIFDLTVCWQEVDNDGR